MIWLIDLDSSLEPFVGTEPIYDIWPPVLVFGYGSQQVKLIGSLYARLSPCGYLPRLPARTMITKPLIVAKRAVEK